MRRQRGRYLNPTLALLGWALLFGLVAPMLGRAFNGSPLLTTLLLRTDGPTAARLVIVPCHRASDDPSGPAAALPRQARLSQLRQAP